MATTNGITYGQYKTIIHLVNEITETALGINPLPRQLSQIDAELGDMLRSLVIKNRDGFGTSKNVDALTAEAIRLGLIADKVQ